MYRLLFPLLAGMYVVKLVKVQVFSSEGSCIQSTKCSKQGCQMVCYQTKNPNLG
jgi:hypothetical protein